MDTNRLFSIVLAAGRSRRYGSCKQLASYRGESLVEKATHLACRITGSNTVLVVGTGWRAVIEKCTPFDGFIARNEDPDKGIGSSIACGVRSIRPGADAVLILLADQPLITADHLHTLLARWQASASSIVASEFASTVGPPVIFPARFFSSLQKLTGDNGAKGLIDENRAEVLKVTFDDAAIDIDTPEDLQKLYRDTSGSPCE